MVLPTRTTPPTRSAGWQTDYIIWANYDVAGCNQTSEVDDLSTNYLSTQLMQLIGAPLT